MPLSNTTLDTLNELAALVQPIVSAIDHKDITIANAWDNPDLAALRDKLTALLTGSGEVEKLLQAGEDLLDQHAALLDQLQGKPLTAEALQQLGLYSAGAIVLSANAIAHVVTPMAIFEYTLQKIWPWILTAVQLGLKIAALV